MRATTRPVPLMISMLPRTCNGPSVCGSMASVPSRIASMSVLPRGRLPAGGELHLIVRAVAERLALRRAAAAQRHAVAERGFTIELDVGTECVRSVLAHGDEIHRRRQFIGLAVLAPITNRTGDTDMRNFHQRIRGHVVGIDPRPLHVRDEYPRTPGHAEARVNAFHAFIDQREIATFDVIDTIDAARRGRHVAWLDFSRAHVRGGGGGRGGGWQGRWSRRRLRRARDYSFGRKPGELALGALRELGQDPERLRHTRGAVRRQRLRAGRELAQPLDEKLPGADARR